MSRHRFTLDLVIDDEALAEHDDTHKPPPKDVTEWDARDIGDAADMGLAELSESDASYIEPLPERPA